MLNILFVSANFISLSTKSEHFLYLAFFFPYNKRSS